MFCRQRREARNRAPSSRIRRSRSAPAPCPSPSLCRASLTLLACAINRVTSRMRFGNFGAELALGKSGERGTSWRTPMPMTTSPSTSKTTPRQRKTVGRVMHEYEHGELKSGPGGKAGPVKNRKQAIAIALHEAGASKYDSPQERQRSFERSKEKEAKGETYQQETEGKSHVGARGKRESSPAMGGENATQPTRRGKSTRKTSNGKAARASRK